ncbi:efflux RND transporter periplasmic adaptor subunit [Pontibacter sp. MBLB2868]|uniref:efflux RND transporter periplasmic adaptor subunit n=1 Tax=Pontibacter sp. MBLB2868 TaxID=3451555 RepID=UPI003F74D192
MLLLWVPVLAFGHGGENHGQAAEPTAAVSYFSAEASSGKYELLLKHGPLAPGRPATLTLYISDYETNAPVDSAALQVSVAGYPNLVIKASKIEPGIFQLRGIFPDTKDYSLMVSLNSKAGPDLLQVSSVKVGTALPGAVLEQPENGAMTGSWLFGVGGVVAGVLLTLLVRRRPKPGLAVSVLVLAAFLPVTSFQKVQAHEGHAAQATAMAASGSFRMEKETQFLYSVLTQRVTSGDFEETVALFGTVLGAPEGMAAIQSPQSGKLRALQVRPGERVAKGQVLALVEQQINAEEQISLEAERNLVEAEYAAAKVHYERLQRIADIAAQKDLSEAKARFQAAEKNRILYQHNRGSAGAKLVQVTSPIAGVVAPFSYTAGTFVSAGETLFQVTSLEKVYVEAQLPAMDELKLQQVTDYYLTHPSGSGASYGLRLLSAAQTVHTENQSRRLVFEVLNPKGELKIGENLRVHAVLPAASGRISVPREAVIQVGGKEAVFVKDNAETVRLRHILKGQDNGRETVILIGLEEGERLIVSSVYQVKTIYLNR